MNSASQEHENCKQRPLYTYNTLTFTFLLETYSQKCKLYLLTEKPIGNSLPIVCKSIFHNCERHIEIINYTK